MTDAEIVIFSVLVGVVSGIIAFFVGRCSK
jgi:hypothetical protein